MVVVSELRPKGMRPAEKAEQRRGSSLPWGGWGTHAGQQRGLMTGPRTSTWEVCVLKRNLAQELLSLWFSLP